MSSDRYAVFCLPRPRKGQAFGMSPPNLDPLDYGVGEEPHPHLLLRRNRVGLFASREDAEAALAKTGKQMAGNDFYKSHAFVVLKCVDRTDAGDVCESR